MLINGAERKQIRPGFKSISIQSETKITCQRDEKRRPPNVGCSAEAAGIWSGSSDRNARSVKLSARNEPLVWKEFLRSNSKVDVRLPGKARHNVPSPGGDRPTGVAGQVRHWCGISHNLFPWQCVKSLSHRLYHDHARDGTNRKRLHVFRHYLPKAYRQSLVWH